MKDVWRHSPIAFVAFVPPPPTPPCPFCDSADRIRVRSEANGDGSTTQKCICRKCEQRYRVCYEPLIARTGNDDDGDRYYWDDT